MDLDGSAGIGQQLQKQIGQTGIPVFNVANACATGATALRTAIMAVTGLMLWNPIFTTRILPGHFIPAVFRQRVL